MYKFLFYHIYFKITFKNNRMLQRFVLMHLLIKIKALRLQFHALALNTDYNDYIVTRNVKNRHMIWNSRLIEVVFCQYLKCLI